MGEKRSPPTASHRGPAGCRLRLAPTERPFHHFSVRRRSLPAHRAPHELEVRTTARPPAPFARSHRIASIAARLDRTLGLDLRPRADVRPRRSSRNRRGLESREKAPGGSSSEAPAESGRRRCPPRRRSRPPRPRRARLPAPRRRREGRNPRACLRDPRRRRPARRPFAARVVDVTDALPETTSTSVRGGCGSTAAARYPRRRRAASTR